MAKIVVLDLLSKKIEYASKVVNNKISELLWNYIVPPVEQTIEEGELFRLGKQMFKIKYINKEGSDGSDMKRQMKLPFRSQDINENIPQLDVLENFGECRICLEGTYPDNPFVNLCKCSRSMPVHLKCLKEWLQKKCEVHQSTSCTVYNIEEIKCDICETKYPPRVTYGSETVNFFNPNLNMNNKHAYIEIYEKNTVEIKNVIILNLNTTKRTFTIGRSEKNDIIIDDASISRNHAELTFTGKKIKLKDLGSKYGTHVLVKDIGFPLLTNSVHLQIDKFYIVVHQYRSKKCFCAEKRRYNVILNPISTMHNYLSVNNINLRPIKNNRASNNDDQNRVKNNESDNNEAQGHNYLAQNRINEEQNRELSNNRISANNIIPIDPFIKRINQSFYSLGDANRIYNKNSEHTNHNYTPRNIIKSTPEPKKSESELRVSFIRNIRQSARLNFIENNGKELADKVSQQNMRIFNENESKKGNNDIPTTSHKRRHAPRLEKFVISNSLHSPNFLQHKPISVDEYLYRFFDTGPKNMRAEPSQQNSLLYFDEQEYTYQFS